MAQDPRRREHKLWKELRNSFTALFTTQKRQSIMIVSVGAKKISHNDMAQDPPWREHKFWKELCDSFAALFTTRKRQFISIVVLNGSNKRRMRLYDNTLINLPN